ncbi:Nuclear receptor domain-containing protein [Aphelenchoides bicaudatus]|nr:Nuclear receptor domain-containing protein [Aphelenchoides bicaudatus]
MDQRKNSNQECQICFCPIQHYNLGAPICRSEAAFFRRTIKENLQYICRTNGNCAQQSTKFKCKSCRFEMCKKLGAHLNNASNNGSSHAVQQSKEPDSTQTTNGNCPSSSTKYPLIQSLINGFDRVIEGQRTLFVVNHPEMGFGEQYIMPKEVRIVEMQTKNVPLWFAMFVDCFGPFNLIGHHHMVEVTMKTFHETNLLSRNYLTSKYFSDFGDNRLMISNGYYGVLDFELWPQFVKETVSVEKQPEIRLAAEKLFSKMLKNVTEYKRLGIRKEDTVVLMLLAIYKTAERLNYFNKDMEQFRESLLTEWSQNLRHEFGEDEGNKQMSRIMAYSVECDNHVIDLENDLIIGKLRWPNESGCCVQQYIEKLSLSEGEYIIEAGL